MHKGEEGSLIQTKNTGAFRKSYWLGVLSIGWFAVN